MPKCPFLIILALWRKNYPFKVSGYFASLLETDFEFPKMKQNVMILLTLQTVIVILENEVKGNVRIYILLRKLYHVRTQHLFFIYIKNGMLSEYHRKRTCVVPFIRFTRERYKSSALALRIPPHKIKICF